jgi:hypothetical protein
MKHYLLILKNPDAKTESDKNYEVRVIDNTDEEEIKKFIKNSLYTHTLTNVTLIKGQSVFIDFEIKLA